MRQETSVPASELAESVQAMNRTFGCTDVLNEFLAVYKAERTGAHQEERPRGNCPVAHAAPANQAACPVKHESSAARDGRAIPIDTRLKIAPYVKLTSLTAELWKTIEASPEPEIASRDGATYAHLYYDALSLEKELPRLTAGRPGTTSAFRTVVALFEGYNRLVIQREGREATGREAADELIIERTLGGFDEGLLQFAMVFDAIVREYEERECTLMPPDQLEAALKASYMTLHSLTQLNYFPDKILDELIVADINPFTVARSVEGVRGEAGAGVRASVWDFVRRLGEELFTNPSANLLGHNSEALFEYILTQLHENVCGDDDRGWKLQGLMLELYKKVVASINGATPSGRPLEGTPLFKQIIARLAKLRVGAPQQRYTQQDAVIVLQRTRFAVDIMDLAAGYRESPENRFTVGCTALRAGIMKKWHARFSTILAQWYRLEYERQAALVETC